MPTYEYACSCCGSFTMLRPIAQRHEPSQCPYCAATGGQLLVSAPALSVLSASQRNAIAGNERSAHAPQTVDQYKAARGHPAGCSCCGIRQAVVPTKANPLALKTRTGPRPWMISH